MVLSQLAPRLYIGDIDDASDARNFEKHNIRAVVTCGEMFVPWCTTGAAPVDIFENFSMPSVCYEEDDFYGGASYGFGFTASPAVADKKAKKEKCNSTMGKYEFHLDEHPDANLRQDALACCSNEDEWCGHGVHHLALNLLDMIGADLLSHLDKCVRFIQKAMDTNPEWNVLVHCWAGQSRSSSVILAYLMSVNREGFRANFDRIKAIYPDACPNHSFVQQLHTFDNLRCRKEYGTAEGKHLMLEVSELNPFRTVEGQKIHYSSTESFGTASSTTSGENYSSGSSSNESRSQSKLSFTETDTPASESSSVIGFAEDEEEEEEDRLTSASKRTSQRSSVSEGFESADMAFDASSSSHVAAAAASARVVDEEEVSSGGVEIEGQKEEEKVNEFAYSCRYSANQPVEGRTGVEDRTPLNGKLDVVAEMSRMGSNERRLAEYDFGYYY